MCLDIIINHNYTICKQSVSKALTRVRLIPDIFFIRNSISSDGSVTLYTVYFAAARATGRLSGLFFLSSTFFCF